MDKYDHPITLEFDLVDGQSPLIVGLDASQYADTCNRSAPRTMIIKRPQDTRQYTLHTYTADDENGNNRLRLQVVPHRSSPMHTLISNTGKNRELSMAKRIHRFGHATTDEMIRLMKPMRFNDVRVKRACETVHNSCAICATSGRPANRKKISTTHVHSAFNNEIQADFLYVSIHGSRHEILNIIDTGTKYGERVITASRSADEMSRQFETQWFYRHGAPKYFSADQEFCRPVLRKFLTKHSITIQPRPSRSSNKTGKVERNNGVFKTVLEKIQKADQKSTPQVLIARASFITNLMRGSKVMSAFQLARGYMPSILGIPRTIVTDELLDAHVERESIRALERIMRSKSPNTIDPQRLTAGTKICVFHKSTKHNEPNEWITAYVVKADEHIVTCRRRAKGPPMTVSHNDIRIMPSGELTDILMRYECTDDDFIDDRSNTADIPLPQNLDEDDDTAESVTVPEVLLGENDNNDDVRQGKANDVIGPGGNMNVPESRAGEDTNEKSLIATALHDVGQRTGEKPKEGNTDSSGGTETLIKEPKEGVNTAGGIPPMKPRGTGVDRESGRDDTLRNSTTEVTDTESTAEPVRTYNVDETTEGSKQTMSQNEGKAKDIGTTTITERQMTGDMGSDIQKVLRDLHGVIGNAQVTISRMQSAPSWVTEKALNEEHDNNWDKAYREVEERSIPRNANVISSHVVYKIKTEETGEHRLKARICPHGNKDHMKDYVRKDSATAQFNIIRLMLTMTTFFTMRMGVVDISGAYMQSGPIKREIYVRPPREWEGTQRGKVWKLLKLPYGVPEAGRQWATVIEDWLTNDMNMGTVSGFSQLFLKRRKDSSIQLILAKITDDLLIAGTTNEMEEFVARISGRFDVSKTIIDAPINFNGCRISQDERGDVTMDMTAYLNTIKPMDITRNRRKEATEKATKDEYNKYRSMAGSIVWAGSGSLPHAAFTGSYMQQRAPTLRVQDLTEANKMLKELKDLTPIVRFRKLDSSIRAMDVWTFSDASFNIVSGRDYGQTGIVTGIMVESIDGQQAFHLVDWASTKQRRISHSSYGAEILACSDADDRGYFLKQGLRSMGGGQDIRHILHVDSRGLFDTISTLHDGKEYRLRQTVQRIRDSFESGDIDILRWVPTGANVADGLTKRCPMVQRKFNTSTAQGTLVVDMSAMKELISKEWK